MLHHKLRIRRQWKCPRCDRTVLTRGNTTSRQCTCVDPAPFMQLVDTPRVPEFDPTQFATYTSPEYATPTEAELVEELPAHLTRPPVERSSEPPKPRRGKGYLRAEISDPDAGEDDARSTEEEPVAADDFGSGLDAEESSSAQPTAENRESIPEARGPVEQQATGSQSGDSPGDDESNSGTDGPGRRRKRRRRRGRKSAGSAESGSDSSKTSESQTSGTENVAVKSDSGAASEASTSAPQSETTGRKRRRRRNRRGKSE